MTQQKEPFKMFTAGPVNVSDAVKKSLIYPEIGHRETEFSGIYHSVREKILKAFAVDARDYSSFVIGGSGTSAMESVLTANIHNGRKMLVINNGAFGDRMAEICAIYKTPLVKANYQWGEYPKIDGIEALIAHEPEIEAVSMVFMETSTGMVNPVREIGELCKKYNKMFIVDAVSGFAGDSLNIKESNVDFCFSNTNKGLSGLPVISFVCAKRDSIEQVRDVPIRNYYLNMLKYHDYAEKSNETPFTPQIPLFYMFNQALDELLGEGVDNRIARYRENSLLMRKMLSDLRFKFQLPEEQMSNVMTNVLMPRNYSYEEFHLPLKERGYIIYPGKGRLEGKIMHVGNIGINTTREVSEFCDSVANIVEKRKAEY